MLATDLLGQPLTLPSGELLANRLAKTAMTEGLADPLGRASPELVRLYRRWADAGCGLLVTGNVQIDRMHLERPGNVIVDRPPDAEGMVSLREWVQAARSRGAGFWMQISHSGRQTPRSVNPRPKAPSDVGVDLPGKQFGRPTALVEEEIREVIDRFVGAAVAAREAGFTGVQLHAAHGYLLSQFLSPRANQRTDRWGGSLENRARLLLDVAAGTRAAVGRDFTLSVKLNSADFQRGGFSADDSLRVVDWLAAAGVDLVEISGGTYEQPRMMDLDGLERPDMNGLTASTAAREGYFLEFARAMRERVRIPLMVTGGFRSADGMARAVEVDRVSLIGIGRPLCTDLDGPARLLRDGGELDRPEARVRIGPGWLGPQSPIKPIKALNGFTAISWYYQQLRQLARTGELHPSLGVLVALVREQRDQAAWLAAARAARGREA
ncbi:MAG TPA: NADH:flavin oxidoreductase/NADH oxidase family protein [Kofleriaceae bacterium]|nr:NADH:flavin oxidoreductase/NADH oxidase family protein [Kofleriaceae bacterium]